MGRARIVFMGTPDLAATCLTRLLQAEGFEIVAAVSQPDRPKGRHLQLQPTPVKSIAQHSGLPVLQPPQARDPQFLEALRAFRPDCIVVAAYGQLLPQTLLDIPKHGCLNVHTSLLPRYRGAAPIQWAILNGDAETGITIMKMNAELDAGDILGQARTPIRHEDDARTVHDRLAEMGAELLIQTLPDYLAGKISPTPQPAEGVVYARKITKADGRVDWTRAATVIWNQVRGLVPWPGAFTHLPARPHPALLKLWRVDVDPRSAPPGTILQADRNGLVVACGWEALRLIEVQSEGKRRMSAQDFLAGHPVRKGDVLESANLPD